MQLVVLQVWMVWGKLWPGIALFPVGKMRLQRW